MEFRQQRSKMLHSIFPGHENHDAKGEQAMVVLTGEASIDGEEGIAAPLQLGKEFVVRKGSPGRFNNQDNFVAGQLLAQPRVDAFIDYDTH